MGIRCLHNLATLFYSRNRSRVPALSSGLLDGNPPPRWGAPDEDQAPTGQARVLHWAGPLRTNEVCYVLLSNDPPLSIAAVAAVQRKSEHVRANPAPVHACVHGLYVTHT
jgi:hypothetical protein